MRLRAAKREGNARNPPDMAFHNYHSRPGRPRGPLGPAHCGRRGIWLKPDDKSFADIDNGVSVGGSSPGSCSIRSAGETDIYGIAVERCGNKLPRRMRHDSCKISIVKGSDDDCQLVFAKTDQNEGTTEATVMTEAIAPPSSSKTPRDGSEANPRRSSHPGVADSDSADVVAEVSAIPSGHSIAHAKYGRGEAVRRTKRE